jgi:hypothetical protein
MDDYQVYRGNGYPSGPHFNLNIISKKADFQCGPATDGYGNVGYGNVIYIPESGVGIRVAMESGAKGPKAAPDLQELQVVDRCTGFATEEDDNGQATAGDGAVLRLPANPEGYAVYARVRGTPTGDPSITITPELGSVESGATVGDGDLLFVGVVTSNRTFSAMSETFTRYPGKQKARDITALFEWSGSVCYDPALGYPGDPDSCCAAGVDGTVTCDDLDPLEGCGEGWTEMYCVAYEPTWVFNIADFVEYFWGLDNSGVKILKVRFYPLPLQ